MNEIPQPPPSVSPPPQIIHIQPHRDKSLPLWLLSSVALGFLLPICACSMLMVTFFIGVGTSVPTGIETLPTAFSDTVAVIRVEGVIYADDSPDFSSTGATSGMVIDHLRHAANDPNVKAIVLRVDSPGGSVVASAQIHEVILTIEKPIVVSMASTAASGGYYISAPTDYIFARPNTITGSIGVIMELINAEELLTELGIETQALTSGNFKDSGGLFRDISADQEAILQALVDEAYIDFVNVVASGRGMEEGRVRQLADGRIYTGRQALANGLIDELGNLQDAIDKAADLGGISGTPDVLEYQSEPTLEDLLFGLAQTMTQSEAEKAQATLQQLSSPRLEYRYIGAGIR